MEKEAGVGSTRTCPSKRSRSSLDLKIDEFVTMTGIVCSSLRPIDYNASNENKSSIELLRTSC